MLGQGPRQLPAHDFGIASPNGLQQARRKGYRRRFFAHASLHGARKLLVHAERAIQMLSDFWDEVPRARFADVFVAEPNRNEDGYQGRQDDGECQTRLNAAERLQDLTRNQ